MLPEGGKGGQFFLHRYKSGYIVRIQPYCLVK